MEFRDGALLVNKPAGMSSFGVIEELRAQMKAAGFKRSQWPKLGHGGTLDPFATGLLVILVGEASKLARYFLGANKGYEGTFRFGETTVPGDPTSEIVERSDVLPESLAALQEMALVFTAQPYLQIPPMHSAKKKDGKPLYELARAGIEIERDPVLCQIHQFKILSYEAPRALFQVLCSSGTYIRTLAQDYARLVGTVGLLESLNRTRSGSFQVGDAWALSDVIEASRNGQSWFELPCWIPFDQLLKGYDSCEATEEEADALANGRQNVLFNLIRRAQPGVSPLSTLPGYPNRETCLAIYRTHRLIAVARNEENRWQLDRVFPR
jgi:tRNA pseudouridine55 synthase